MDYCELLRTKTEFYLRGEEFYSRPSLMSLGDQKTK